MSATNSPAAKTERLLNLVLVLLYTRRPLTKAQIRRTIEAYAAAPSAEAFDRTFERDKDELRELGIPLVTEVVSAGWDDEQILEALAHVALGEFQSLMAAAAALPKDQATPRVLPEAA